MVRRDINHFDLAQICQSGQCFRMYAKNEKTYSIIAGEHYLEVEQEGNTCVFHCGQKEFEKNGKHILI